MTFRDFDDYWGLQTPAFSPQGKAIAGLPQTDRVKLIEAVRVALPLASDGSVAYWAWANAIKSRVSE